MASGPRPALGTAWWAFAVVVVYAVAGDRLASVLAGEAKWACFVADMLPFAMGDVGRSETAAADMLAPHDEVRATQVSSVVGTLPLHGQAAATRASSAADTLPWHAEEGATPASSVRSSHQDARRQMEWALAISNACSADQPTAVLRKDSSCPSQHPGWASAPPAPFASARHPSLALRGGHLRWPRTFEMHRT